MKIDEMIEELQVIVEKLESGQVGIEQALELYKKGMELYKKLFLALKSAQIEVQDIYAQIGEINSEQLPNT